MDFGSRIENFVINLHFGSGDYTIDLESEEVKMSGFGIYIKQHSTEMIRGCVEEKARKLWAIGDGSCLVLT